MNPRALELAAQHRGYSDRREEEKVKEEKALLKRLKEKYEKFSLWLLWDFSDDEKDIKSALGLLHNPNEEGLILSKKLVDAIRKIGHKEALKRIVSVKD
jgi:hypothetical protein